MSCTQLIVKRARERAAFRSCNAEIGIAITIGARAAKFGLMPRAPLEHYQLLGVLDRQRFQHQGIDQAENRRIRADSERQSEHRDGGEPGILSQNAQPETSVL